MHAVSEYKGDSCSAKLCDFRATRGTFHSSRMKRTFNLDVGWEAWACR